LFIYWNKFENLNEKWNFGESDDEGAFNALEFIFKGQMQLKMHIYRVVENSTGYPNL
jgi:hypothetical protein